MLRIKTVLPAMISLTLIAVSASGQVAPIKPGLWQVQMERETNGQKGPDMSERLKHMPPERRAGLRIGRMHRRGGICGSLRRLHGH